MVYDFNIARPGLAIRPLETNAPLLVDANGILSSAISFERFEPVSWQSAQRIEGQRRVQDRQPPGGLIFKAPKRSDELTLRKLLRLLVSIAQDHTISIAPKWTLYVKRQYLRR
jgi:hypothetical protein